ncbi:MAG: hypothetical protein LBJ11_05600 [Oscillospiraceae bacterium]|jgi:DNA-directed RNA polymerase alpha subunit|nr:hypothetical protein [Oscillospiraceae bacterium]
MNESLSSPETPEQDSPQTAHVGQELAKAAVAAAQSYEQCSIEELRALLVVRDAQIAALQGEEALPDDPNVSGISLDDLHPSVRLYNALKRGGIQTVGDLLPLTYEKILRFNNMGPRLVAELREKLGKLGVTLSER